MGCKRAPKNCGLSSEDVNLDSSKPSLNSSTTQTFHFIPVFTERFTFGGDDFEHCGKKEKEKRCIWWRFPRGIWTCFKEIKNINKIASFPSSFASQKVRSLNSIYVAQKVLPAGLPSHFCMSWSSGLEPDRCSSCTCSKAGFRLLLVRVFRDYFKRVRDMLSAYQGMPTPNRKEIVKRRKKSDIFTHDYLQFCYCIKVAPRPGTNKITSSVTKNLWNTSWPYFCVILITIWLRENARCPERPYSLFTAAPPVRAHHHTHLKKLCGTGKVLTSKSCPHGTVGTQVPCCSLSTFEGNWFMIGPHICPPGNVWTISKGSLLREGKGKEPTLSLLQLFTVQFYYHIKVL